MTSAPSTDRPSRARWVIVLVIVGIIAAIAVSAFLVWLVFFSTDAPPAPTIGDAVDILRASPAPGE